MRGIPPSPDAADRALQRATTTALSATPQCKRAPAVLPVTRVFSLMPRGAMLASSPADSSSMTPRSMTGTEAATLAVAVTSAKRAEERRRRGETRDAPGLVVVLEPLARSSTSGQCRNCVTRRPVESASSARTHTRTGGAHGTLAALTSNRRTLSSCGTARGRSAGNQRRSSDSSLIARTASGGATTRKRTS